MVKRKALEDEKKRYEDFLVNITNELKGAKKAELQSFEEKRKKLHTKKDKMVEKAQKSGKAFTSEKELLDAMSFFEKKELKRVLNKIKKLDGQINTIKEKETTPIFQAQQEINLLLKERDLIDDPSKLIAFTQELSRDILRIEQNPDYEKEIKRKWQLLQNAFAVLVQDKAQDFTTIKTEMENLLKQNQEQLINDLDNLLASQPSQQKQALQVQFNAKKQKIKVKNEYGDLLKDLLAKIPKQEKTATVTSVDIKSKDKSEFKSTTNADTSKLPAIVNAAKQKGYRTGVVEEKIVHFEKLAKENQQKSKSTKTKKPS